MHWDLHRCCNFDDFFAWPAQIKYKADIEENDRCAVILLMANALYQVRVLIM